MNAAVTALFRTAAFPLLLTFFYLQLLDFLTTAIALKLGMMEASPFIRWLMHAGAQQGLFESKLLAVGLAGVCLYSNRMRLIRWINRWYAVLVLWNLCLLFLAGSSNH
jgi:hypothetical protein